MILTREIEETIIAAIQEHPERPLILPDFAYTKNLRVIVTVEGLPIDLHRHLHNKLIRPLGYHERMHHPEGMDRRNVNPHLFTVIEGKRSPATHCRRGHAYEGNEAPPNSRGYRCATCLRNLWANPSQVANSEKTHCPEGHEYTPANTRVYADGRRRCITCARNRNRDHMRRVRAAKRKESTP